MRRAFYFALKVSVVSCLVAAILDVKIPSGHLPRTRVYLLDVSASVHVPGESGSLRLRDAWKIVAGDAGRFDRVAVILFGRTAKTHYDGPGDELPLSPPDFPAPPETDVGAALEAALLRDPDEIVLLSDGDGRSPLPGKALLACAERSVPVHTIALGPRAPADARIAAVRGPARVPPGSDFTIEVDLHSEIDCEVTLSLHGVARKKAALVRKQPRTLRFPGLHVSERTHFLLELSPDDACPENNRAEWIVEPATDRRRVLLLAPSPSGLDAILERDKTIHLVKSNLFRDPSGFDVVILDSFPAKKMTRRQQERLRDFVTGWGGGLLVMGGPGSYAPGGYAGTPVEEILPVWAFPEESLAVVFVLDRSGSMAADAPGMDRRKLDAAVDAVSKALDALRPRDRASVITFAGDRKVLSPLTTARAGIRDRLEKEQPGGPTVLLPALREGVRMLQETTSARKSLVLLTDGKTDEETRSFAALERELRAGGIKLLSIHTGASPGEALEALGNPVPVNRWENLATQLDDWVKESQELVVTPTSSLEPTGTISGTPGKINRVAMKEAANLVVRCGDHPVVATRQAGRGKVVAVTFALRTGWVGAISTPGKFLRQSIRDLAPSPLSPFRLSAFPDGETIELTVRGPATGPVELAVEYELHPGRIRGEWILEQTSATTWERKIPLPDPGIAWYRVTGYRGGTVAVPIPSAAEFTRLGPDRTRLETIADRTSGIFIRKEADLSTGAERRRAWKNGRTLFLAAALVLFLLDVALWAFWRPSRFERAKNR